MVRQPAKLSRRMIVCIAGRSFRLLRTLACVTLLLSAGESARASVLVTGNVLPADDPFTLNVNEGLPIDGNFVNPFEAVDHQTFFEGLHDDGANPLEITDDFNINVDVIVGQTSFGTMLISGESALRDQDLIIGESGILPSSGQARAGTGVVRITGFGSLYNNDPAILPAGLPSNFQSETPRNPAIGFDLWVGRAGPTTPDVGGTGLLEITAGGRAEIQDAVLIGYDAGSTGTIIVDGIDSFLGSGGFDGGGAGEPHQIMIGRRGTGFLTISNGGTVYSEGPPQSAGGGTEGPVGAVIGSEPFDGGMRPESGGQGTVVVTGSASKWIIGGSLQIGGFHNAGDIITGEDVEGDTVEYRSETGRGTLRIVDNGFVNVRPVLEADPQDNELLVAIGRFGRLEMAGGMITIGGAEDDDPRPDEIQLINDGVITGFGRINTGVFRNRYFGEVRVGPSEKLIIDSSSEFTAAGTNAEPLSNFGRIEVFGNADTQAEIEFERAPDTPAQPIRPFFNLRVDRPAGAPPSDFYGGIITAQHSIMRFRSDIVNQGMMAFTDGDNYVTGNVFNIDPDPGTPDDEGIIFISGPNTKVVFENDLLSTGTIIIEEGADVDILHRHSFVTAGNLNIDITPTEFTNISTAGDVGIAGSLTVNLSGFAPGSLTVGQQFEIISAGGSIGGVDLSDPLRPAPDLTAEPSFSQLSIFGTGLPAGTLMIPIFTASSVLLEVVDFTVGVALAGDYNNDGVVDAADYIVWRRNAGTSNPLVNDPFGGVIGAVQYNVWRANFGQMAGAGGGALGAVPEPGSLLLVLSGMLALAVRRQR